MQVGRSSSGVSSKQVGLKKAGAMCECFTLKKNLNIANTCGQEQHHQQQQAEQQACLQKAAAEHVSSPILF